jgi:hypothetical protein
MPLLPLVKIGLSPLLPCVLVPVTALTLTRRLARVGGAHPQVWN